MLTTTQIKIGVPGRHEMVRLLGALDELLKVIESAFSTRIVARGNEITLSGEARETEQVAKLFQELIVLLDQGHQLTKDSVGRSIDIIKSQDGERPSTILSDNVL